ncbi:MAG: polymerase, sigma-24 subunit, subfamily [Myxococcaceae bacterium]|nr:polymerase, sigma-24 subunit, subfamily [Myxococcaceae bacterium]
MYAQCGQHPGTEQVSHENEDYGLLHRWRAGDMAAGEALVTRHFPSLRRFFHNKVGAEMEDLLQQTFLGCVEARDLLREEASFRTFLFAIARFQLFTFYRRQSRHGQLDFTRLSVRDLRTSPSSAVAREQRHRRLQAALQSLPVDHQIALELAYWEGLTASEIAGVLGIPENTVYSRLHRAKGQLRSLLRDGAPSA